MERVLGINENLTPADVIVAVDGVRLEKPFVVDCWHQGPDAVTVYDLSGTDRTYRKYTVFTVQPRFK